MNEEEPPLSAEMLEAYRRTIVTVEADGQWVEAHRFASTAAPSVVHVLTAWNPFSTELALAENEERNRRLAADLAELDATVHLARGSDSVSSWHEDGFAIVGLTRKAACELGRRYEQHAIFEFTAHEQLVVGCRTASVLA